MIFRHFYDSLQLHSLQNKLREVNTVLENIKVGYNNLDITKAEVFKMSLCQNKASGTDNMVGLGSSDGGVAVDACDSTNKNIHSGMEHWNIGTVSCWELCLPDSSKVSEDKVLLC